MYTGIRTPDLPARDPTSQLTSNYTEELRNKGRKSVSIFETDKNKWTCLLLANKKVNHINVMSFKILSNNLTNHKRYFLFSFGNEEKFVRFHITEIIGLAV